MIELVAGHPLPNCLGLRFDGPNLCLLLRRGLAPLRLRGGLNAPDRFVRIGQPLHLGGELRDARAGFHQIRVALGACDLIEHPHGETDSGVGLGVLGKRGFDVHGYWTVIWKASFAPMVVS